MRAVRRRGERHKTNNDNPSGRGLHVSLHLMYVFNQQQLKVPCCIHLVAQICPLYSSVSQAITTRATIERTPTVRLAYQTITPSECQVIQMSDHYWGRTP